MDSEMKCEDCNEECLKLFRYNDMELCFDCLEAAKRNEEIDRHDREQFERRHE